MSPRPVAVRSALPCALACLALVASVALARAQAWTEQGDAGPLPPSAQFTVGTGPLATISGTLDHDADVDMYCIQIVEPASFSAWLNCSTLSNNDIWLFSQFGFGVARDRGCQGGQTRVGFPLVPAAGLYFLVVTGNDASATSSGSDIWQLATPVTGQAAPNGPAAALPLNGWVGGLVNPLAYSIQLVGATFCDTPVPARPHTWGATKVIYR